MLNSYSKGIREETMTQRGEMTTNGHGKRGKEKRGELDFSGIAKATRMSCSNIFPKTTNVIICTSLKNLPCLPHPARLDIFQG